jgi:type IV pilus assembly protein PilA
MRKNNRKGFTIVELVIVIAVIAVLAGVLIPTFAGVTKNAKESKALQEVKAAYTVYMAEQLSAKAEPAEKLYVDCDGIIVEVVNGQASVVDAAGATSVEYEFDTNEDGDKTLKIVAEEASSSN